MAIKDILLTLTSYPDPTSKQVVEDAVAIAARLDAHIGAIACEVHVEVPGSFLANSMVSVQALIADEARKSLANAQDLLAFFEATAKRQSVPCETVLERCLSSDGPGLFVEYARMRDLTITSVPNGYDPWVIEAIMFGSGRPVLVLPERPRAKPLELKAIVVAWDFSRAAARAVADAMPLLEKAATVRIVTVTDEKALNTRRSGAELARNLARHNVDVVLDEISADGRGIGEVLESHALSHAADMLVMGAYGHSRFREFILGGATRSMLERTPLPLLFSH